MLLLKIIKLLEFPTVKLRLSLVLEDLAVSEINCSFFALLTMIFSFKSDDEDNYETFPCGRPLGMTFDVLDENNLIVVHSFMGIFEVNLKTGDKKILLSNEEVIGKEVRFNFVIFLPIFKMILLEFSTMSIFQLFNGCQKW